MNRMTRMLGLFATLHYLVFVVCTGTEKPVTGGAWPTTLTQLSTPNAEDMQQLPEDQPKHGEETETPANADFGLEVATAGKAGAESRAAEAHPAEDTTARFAVRKLRISGNTLISTEELLQNLPETFNASDRALDQAESGDLYSFKVLREVIQNPGPPRDVSRRAMQGLTRYVLSVYQDRGYAGIYVYVAAQVVDGSGRLQDGVLPVEVVEARISEIKITSYNTEREKVDKGILRNSLVEAWSPAKVGQVANKRKLDYFVNLLNLNSDRYVSAVVSRGSEPNSLALGYDVYEGNPWHIYIQADNSGTEERQWAPRVGLVNTNLTGRDDRLSALYQAPWESGMEDNYLLFGSYELPVFTPRLRLGVFGGRSEFDTTPEGGPLHFLGKGSFYGGTLRFNVFEKNGWFFDVTSSLSHENSKVTPKLFQALASDIDMDLWAAGVDLHRSDDMSNASVRFNRIQSVGGSSKSEFAKARQGADPHFDIYAASAAYSKYLNTNKVQRLSGSLRWIATNERLAPSKMTTFGGLYSVRGYEEDEIVADGGVLASVQYEFDLVKYCRGENGRDSESKRGQSAETGLRKLAPLAFFDYGRAKIEDSVPGEKGVQELCSVGVGVLVEIGDNFGAGVYYGWALRSTTDTDRGGGRLGVSLTGRF